MSQIAVIEAASKKFVLDPGVYTEILNLLERKALAVETAPGVIEPRVSGVTVEEALHRAEGKEPPKPKRRRKTETEGDEA